MVMAIPARLKVAQGVEGATRADEGMVLGKWVDKEAARIPSRDGRKCIWRVGTAQGDRGSGSTHRGLQRSVVPKASG